MPGATPHCELKIKAVPNASKSELVGRLGDAWKVRLQAVPEDGKANKALVAFLAEKLSVSRKSVELVAGSASHEKRLRIEGLSVQEVEQRLQA
ncbi:MAG: DUF167 domain-containing protein [Puniceicoccales bacterium]|jgi:uncharacterized protein (TIGR00251 family)|nr:DUF167 domain-containing protein [Puniceicoccales bacterium]